MARKNHILFGLFALLLMASPCRAVDPLTDKYPGQSGYMYCGGNPIMLVDPDGEYSVNKIPNRVYNKDQATHKDAQRWLNAHDPTGKSSVFYVTFHFTSTPSIENIVYTIQSFEQELTDWSIKYDQGELQGTNNKIKHVVIQACYGDPIAFQVAKDNPGVYVSGATEQLTATYTSNGYKNISNKEKKTKPFLFWNITTEVEGVWNTYYCDPTTKEVKLVFQHTQAEPPVLRLNNTTDQ